MEAPCGGTSSETELQALLLSQAGRSRRPAVGQIQVGAVRVNLPAVETCAGVVVRLQVHGGDVSHLAIESADRMEPNVDFNSKQFRISVTSTRCYRDLRFKGIKEFTFLSLAAKNERRQYLMSHQPLSVFLSTSTVEPMGTDTSSSFCLV